MDRYPISKSEKNIIDKLDFLFLLFYIIEMILDVYINSIIKLKCFFYSIQA